METHKFGSIYCDGKAYGPKTEFTDSVVVTIGNTEQDKELGWIKAGDIYVCSRTIFPRASWKALDNLGLITGRPLSIDGKPYLCRAPKVGLDSHNPGKWDELLNEVGDMDSIWNCEGLWFWGQEVHPENHDFAVCRGGEEPRGWNYAEIHHQSPKIGFRPVLEQLPPMPILDEGMIGTRLRMYGEEGYFDTVLADFNDYDITAKLVGEMDLEFSWAQRDGDEVAISRDGLVWMERV